MTSALTPAAFVAKWKPTKLSERAASQEHFLDLCQPVFYKPVRLP
jgi:hypothetical protein